MRRNMSKRNIAIIGLGKRGNDYIPLVIENEGLSLCCACESTEEKRKLFQKEYHRPAYENIDIMLEAHPEIQVAVIAVPHANYVDIIEKLSQKHIAIIKEKPLAESLGEAIEIMNSLTDSQVPMMVTTQRAFHPNYATFYDYQKSSLLGQIVRFTVNYTMPIKDLEAGWRSNSGALVDMGYHMIDLVVSFFGLPAKVTARTTTDNRPGQHYTCEDTVTCLFDYNQTPTQKPFYGEMTVSRLGPSKQEKVTIYGTESILEITPQGVSLLNLENEVISIIEQEYPAALLIRDQLQHFIDALDNPSLDMINHYMKHIQHVLVIESAYESARSHSTVMIQDPQVMLENYRNQPENPWPIVTPEMKSAVLAQMDKSLSIYDRSDIFEEFEDEWAKRHNASHAVLFNSGTAALFALYFGAGLATGDKVLVPNYTFPATNTPFAMLGVKIIPFDCDDEGNADINDIETLLAMHPDAKAVVVTHLWGMPCSNMIRLRQLCDVNQKYLFEDCSHAHFAKYQGQTVGTFGHGAVWSLQGQKPIAGGEGGILVTNDDEIFYKALMLGHPNKRSKQQVPRDSEFAEYASSGFGLKLRASPLHIAIAMQQLKIYPSIIDIRNRYARGYIEAFREFEFLVMPDCTDKEPSWYAFVIQYKQDVAGYPIEAFCEALTQEGLKSVERQGATCPNHTLALFTKPPKHLHRFFEHHEPTDRRDYPGGDKFFTQAIRIPVWATEHDHKKVTRYIQGIRKVAESIRTQTLEDNYVISDSFKGSVVKLSGPSSMAF